MKMVISEKWNGDFSEKTVDDISALFVSSLEKSGCDRKDILRLRLSLEDILCSWLPFLSSARTGYRSGKRLGRSFIEISVKGDEIRDEDEIRDYTLSSYLLSQAGLSITKSYRNGMNVLSVYPGKKKRMGQLPKLLIAIILAVMLGLMEKLLPERAKELTDAVTGPLFNLVLNLLCAISSPMIFLAITWGIFNIGDISTLGRLGRKVITDIIVLTFLIAVVSSSVLIWFFPLSLSSDGTSLKGGLGEIYGMILDIVPSDIVSPFLEGNTLQIIFLGTAVGVALLILGDRVSATRAVIEQMNEVVSLLMGAITKFIPAFVFLSVFSLVGTDFSGEVYGIFRVILLTFIFAPLISLVLIAVLSVKHKVRFSLLLRKLLPTFLIGISTASSSAAFATNMETCEKKLGIDSVLAHFAIPLGQVIFKPGALVGFPLVCLAMAEIYSVPITPVWVVTMVIIVALLSMAAPPVPGGAITCYTVMFSQLSIPVEAVAIAVAVNSVIDFIMTANNLTCLQAVTVMSAGKLGMLDRKILASDGDNL